MRRGESGQTLIESLLIVGIVSVISSAAVMQLGQSGPAMKADGAMRVILAQLNTAREMSISQRREMRVQFMLPNQVQIVRQEVPAGTTVLSTVALEGGVQFGLEPSAPDTPDGFGKHAPIDFGAAASIYFNSDGTLINESGNPSNGTVFLALPNRPMSFRAVTILGGTGRVRGYRWNGAQWSM
jgi:type II secretory pathway pseudopilin PulG